MTDDDRDQRADASEHEDDNPSPAEEEKAREVEEEGGEDRVEADFTSQDRMSAPFNPDEPGVAPPDSTHNKPA